MAEKEGSKEGRAGRGEERRGKGEAVAFHSLRLLPLCCLLATIGDGDRWDQFEARGEVEKDGRKEGRKGSRGSEVLL